MDAKFDIQDETFYVRAATRVEMHKKARDLQASLIGQGWVVYHSHVNTYANEADEAVVKAARPMGWTGDR